MASASRGIKMFAGKTVLITGGTGSFGREFVKTILGLSPKKVIVFSRDEYKQSEMAKDITDGCVRFMLGDVRDYSRLKRVFSGVNYVVHAAALKQVPALEYNPTEAISTNVNGARNVVEAAIDAGVEVVVALSTDKAVNPVNLYGATKLCAEKIFTAANAFNKTVFASVRYGNVIGSRGSVIPLFLNLKEKGIKEFPITNPDMTRFWITLEDAVWIVIQAFMHTVGGEIYVPQIPSMRMSNLAKAIDPECELKITGIRPGEKMHEILVSEDCANVYHFGDRGPYPAKPGYTSDTNTQWMERFELRKILGLEKIYV